MRSFCGEVFRTFRSLVKMTSFIFENMITLGANTDGYWTILRSDWNIDIINYGNI